MWTLLQALLGAMLLDHSKLLVSGYSAFHAKLSRLPWLGMCGLACPALACVACPALACVACPGLAYVDFTTSTP